jgi:chondroitin 4-sulfotransferase 11
MFGIMSRSTQIYRLLRARYISNVAFVHINKTGGTSIEQALGLRFQHLTAIELRDQLGARYWNEKFSFAFVRNPWDKVASHYRYRVKTNQTELGVRPIPFDEWVRLAYGENVPKYYDQPKMFMPQLDWICDQSGQVIVNFVGRFERLNDDFQEVCKEIGVRAELPHVKQTVQSDYRPMYTTETAEIVARWFEKDLAAFGYTFDRG